MSITFPVERIHGQSDLEFAETFYRALAATGEAFRKDDGSIWFIRPGIPPDRVNSLLEFGGKVHNLVTFTKAETDGSTRPCTPGDNLLKLLFFSDGKMLLPCLEALVYEPAVVPSQGGYALTQPGYHAENGVYYRVPPGSMPIEPLAGTHHLETAFSGVPFELPAHRNNLIGYLLGAVVLDSRVESPLLVVSGNQRGLGKSKTVEAAGYILTGQSQAPIPQRPEETEKHLSARFSEGARFVAFDNVTAGERGSYRNDALARQLTAGFSKKVRILGHSRNVEQRGVVFALSCNDSKLDTDLSSRSLPVRLYAERSRPMHPYVLDYVKQYRREIYGELLGLALRAPVPIPPGLHETFRFRRWLEFVYSRVVPALGEMAIAASRELDDRTTEAFAWAYDRPDVTAHFTAREFLDQLSSNREKYPALAEHFLAIPNKKVRSQSASKFLRNLCDEPITLAKGVVLVMRTGDVQDRAQTFYVEVISSGEEAA